MSKRLNLEHIISSKEQYDRYSRTVFEDNYKRCDIELFKASYGIYYIKSDVLCSSPIRRNHEKGIEYSFLFFNNIANPLVFKANKKHFTLNQNEFWIGCVSSDFKGVCEYHSRRYAGQSIIISNSLSSEIKEFQNLNFIDGIAIAKGKINFTNQLILNQLAGSQIYSGKMLEIFMESKILEILYRMFGKNDNSHNHDLCDKEIRILEKAKQILLNDLQNPPSIKKLAHLCSTNDFKLKNDFKKYFGATIYGMLQNERLNTAKELLIQNALSVKEAAKLVGYSSTPHFAKIFKNKFGIYPIELIKQRSYFILTSS